MVHAVLHTIQKPVVVTAVDRLLPNSHPIVREHLGTKRVAVDPGRHIPRQKSGAQAKWVKLHMTLRNRLLQGGAKGWQSNLRRRVPAPTGCSAELLGLTNPRKVDMWSLLCRQHGQALFAADLSQNVGRARISTSGELPTITPRSDIAVAPLGRRLIPIEHLLANGFRLRKMRLPSTGCTKADIAMPGGNTMRALSVGSVILIGLCVLDLTRSLGTGSAPRGRSTGGAISVVSTKAVGKQHAKRATTRGRENGTCRKRAGSDGATSVPGAPSGLLRPRGRSHRRKAGMGSTDRLRELFVSEHH